VDRRAGGVVPLPRGVVVTSGWALGAGLAGWAVGDPATATTSGLPPQATQAERFATSQPVGWLAAPRGDPYPTSRLSDQALEPLAQLVGGLVGERDDEQSLGRLAVVRDHGRGALGQHAGLAGARARKHEQRARRRQDRLRLVRIERRARGGSRPRIRHVSSLRLRRPGGGALASPLPDLRAKRASPSRANSPVFDRVCPTGLAFAAVCRRKRLSAASMSAAKSCPSGAGAGPN
jgi:hypothetical protein